MFYSVRDYHVVSAKELRLESTVAALQVRFGTDALRRLKKTADVPAIPTGFAGLDAILECGGIPRGRITELLGAPTSGMSTLALKTMAMAQNQQDSVVYVDLARTFDPDYAARCGVRVEKLYLARPAGGRQALEITLSLIAGGAGMLVFDSVAHLLHEPLGSEEGSSILRRLNRALSDSPCALVFLTALRLGDGPAQAVYPSGFALAHYAAVRLALEKERWITKQRDIDGYRARATVLKNKLGAAGKNTSLDILFDGIVQGDGT